VAPTLTATGLRLVPELTIGGMKCLIKTSIRGPSEPLAAEQPGKKAKKLPAAQELEGITLAKQQVNLRRP
jgi:hypothetical protein